MTRALWELHLRSLRGRVRRWGRLLRQPKYLAGFLVGALWFGFWAVRPILRMWGRGFVRLKGFSLDGWIDAVPPAALEGAEIAAACLLAVVLLLWWLVPFNRPPLNLTEPEADLLLPAPLSRRSIIQYGLFKNQPGILISAIIMSVFVPLGGMAARLTLLVTLWVLFTLWDLHGMARNLWLARQSELPLAAAATRRVVLYVVAGGLFLLLGAEVVWLRDSLAPAAGAIAKGFAGGSGVEAAEVETWLRPLLDSWVALVLTPLRWMIRPLLTAAPVARLLGLLLPLAALLAHREWVLRSQARFEDAALTRARRRASKKTPAARFNRFSRAARRRQPFRLLPQGAPETAILWKNMILARRLGAGTTLLLTTGIVLVAALLPALLKASEIIFFMMAGGGGVLFAFLPLATGMHHRNDLRADLPHLEALGAWPLRSTRLMLAEIAAPLYEASLRAYLGLGLVLAAIFGSQLKHWLYADTYAARFEIPMGAALGTSDNLAVLFLGLGVVPLALAAAAVSAVIQNLAALLFPGWVQLGPRRRREGAANFGQQMLVFWVLSLLILMGLLPGAVLVGIILGGQWWLGFSIVAWELPILGLLAAVPLLIEAALLLRAAAGVWERLDPSREILAEAG